MAALNYLTVQDLLWVHQQLTKRTASFDFAKLEEATFYQYGYGASSDLVKQAAGFLRGFSKQAPFAERDDEVALIGTVAFLAINGYRLNLPGAEAKSWMNRVKSGDTDPVEALSKLAIEEDSHHAPAPREALEHAIAEYA